jgi:selenocysteine lyase/cysteine desulfurase
MIRSAPALVGTAIPVPLLGGGSAPYVNLDFAASAPALTAVNDAVAEFLPYYSSVHRGAGWKSRISTQAYEVARSRVAGYVNARPDDVVVFTRNTTDALNVLAAALPAGTHVVTFSSEHHANLLPWRRHAFTCLRPGRTEAETLELLATTLASVRPAAGVLVAVTGASNVTGEIWPVAEIVEFAHRHGARVVVDCAQLAPHAPVDVTAWDADYVAVSGHKLYAPFGAGALVGRRDWLDQGDPLVRGGGAVTFVTETGVLWNDAPGRQEAGSPNVVGAVALGAACAALSEYGMQRVAAHEQAINRHVANRLAAIPGLQRYLLWPQDHPRISVFTFNLRDLHYSLVAAALAAEHGVAVRGGCFCAHPLMLQLLGIEDTAAEALRRQMAAGASPPLPGAVRLSTGLGSTLREVDLALDAIEELAQSGPRATYLWDDGFGAYVPEPDDRPTPPLSCLQPPQALVDPGLVMR